MPAALALLPDGERDAFDELRHLEGERAVAIEAEGTAIEDQLILPAELVDEDQRQAGLDDAGERHLLALTGLVLPVGRGVGHDQHLGAGLGQALAHLLQPDVLADGKAEPEPAETDGAGKRADREDAHLVEDAVIGQFDLVAHRRDRAAVEQRDGVVALALVRPGRADDDARATVGGIGSERFDRLAAGILEGRLEHEVFRRITGDEQLRQDEQVGIELGRPGAGGAGLLEVAVDVADDDVELRGGDADGVGQICCHGRRCSPPANGRQSEEGLSRLRPKAGRRGRPKRRDLPPTAAARPGCGRCAWRHRGRRRRPPGRRSGRFRNSEFRR